MNLSRLGLLTLALFLATVGAAEARTTVLESSEQTLKLRVELPRAQFVDREADGERYVEMTMEGLSQAGADGQPGLPVATTLFGIPQGADVSLRISNVESYMEQDILLYPAQPDPLDDGSPTPPFTIDERAYASDDPVPAELADARPAGTMRDVHVGGVTVYGGQYNARARELRVIESMDVTITFGGDNRGVFATSGLNSHWNIAFRNDYEALVNIETILDRLESTPLPRFCGEELLIVTSRELRPAADQLATYRREQGYVTGVREVGSGSGQIGETNTEIQAFIRDHLTNPECLIHPSYVILLGDTANVPTFHVPCGEGGDPAACDIASDLPYSLDGTQNDYFADVQLGRLPAPDLVTANGLVEKLNRYATSAPAPINDSFYRRAAVTSYFEPAKVCVLNAGATPPANCHPQNGPVNAHLEVDPDKHRDTRTFTTTAETVRPGIMAAGYDVDRLYNTEEEATPEEYYDGTPIPAELRKPTFGWDTGSQEFLDTYNEGRFVMLHRGHGWRYGWASPTLHTGHVPSMNNGTQTPVVFGVDCESARFDNPGDPSFVELQVTKPDGGAIAGFGDTRVSPHFPNTQLAIGFFDAMFPQTVPDYGGAGTTRLGDILIRGKQYLATQAGVAQYVSEGDIYTEFHLYHLLGDPTMQMWSKPPTLFDPDRIQADLNLEDRDWFVDLELLEELADGTIVTLFQGERAIGRSVVRDGNARIDPEVDVEPEELTVSLQQDGALPAHVRVEE